MKFLKYIGFVAALSLIIVSCADEPLPYETFEEYAKGAIARQTGTDNGSFFFTDPDNSSFTLDVEYYGENNGGNVAAHEWRARHRDNANGGTLSEEVVVARVEKSSFGTNAESGLPSANFLFEMNDVLSALGLTINDVNGGDDIILDGYVIMDDGREFGPDQTDPSLQGDNGFNGVFRIVKGLVCESDLTGTYTAETTGMSTDGCCPDETTLTETVTLSAGDGAGQYIISDWTARMYFTWYEVYGITSDFDMSTTLSEACGNVSANFVEPFGTETSIVGSVDFDSGVITYTWLTGYDDTATVVLTPQ